MLSIIVPTYNEVENVKLLALRIAKALGDNSYEIVFVDDSTDETPEVLAELCKLDSRVHFHHRTDARGLASAVVEGFQLAKGDCLAVMDADLQHPPELLPQMYRAVESGVELVVPSRFVPGGSDGGLRLHRKLVSWTARKVGQLMLHRLRAVSDPTGGFFMLRKSVIEGVHLNPIGWKILIEVLIKGNYQRIVELPYRFASRAHNTSKMAIREQVNYLKHLARLMQSSPSDRRFWQQTLREGIAFIAAIIAFIALGELVQEPWPVILAALAFVPANKFLNISYGGRRYPFAPRRFSLALMLAMLSSGVGGIVLAYLALNYWLAVPAVAAFVISSLTRTWMVLWEAGKIRTGTRVRNQVAEIEVDIENEK